MAGMAQWAALGGALGPARPRAPRDHGAGCRRHQAVYLYAERRRSITHPYDGVNHGSYNFNFLDFSKIKNRFLTPKKMSQLATCPPQVGKHIYGRSPPRVCGPQHNKVDQCCTYLSHKMSLRKQFLENPKSIYITIHRNALRLHYYYITLFIQLYNQTLVSHNAILERSFYAKTLMSRHAGLPVSARLMHERSGQHSNALRQPP